MREHPNYVYQPRKPGEKKRRMTRRKKEALASAMSASAGLPATSHGNIVLEFGDDQKDIKDLRAKIEKHNHGLTPISEAHNQFIKTLAPSSIYSERTHDYQNQMNFLEEILGSGTIDPSLLAQTTSSPANGSTQQSHQFHRFHQAQANNFTAEVIRMQHLFN